MHTIEHQEIGMAALYAICTNPEMVAKNIDKLREEIAKARVTMAELEQKKAENDARFSQAEALEQQNEAFAISLKKREDEIIKKEEHWLFKNDKQLEAEKEFNEEKVNHAAKVRQLEIDRQTLTDEESNLDKREATVADLESTAQSHESTAASLRKEYEDKLKHIKSFASSVGGT